LASSLVSHLFHFHYFFQAIAVDEELCYDYGERDPETLRALPWLKE
jgi:hypothetical protein